MDGLQDKSSRRYASAVERALSLFDTTLQEWADYISFLGRLLKVEHFSSFFEQIIDYSFQRCYKPDLLAPQISHIKRSLQNDYHSV